MIRVPKENKAKFSLCQNICCYELTNKMNELIHYLMADNVHVCMFRHRISRTFWRSSLIS